MNINVVRRCAGWPQPHTTSLRRSPFTIFFIGNDLLLLYLIFMYYKFVYLLYKRPTQPHYLPIVESSPFFNKAETNRRHGQPFFR